MADLRGGELWRWVRTRTWWESAGYGLAFVCWTFLWLAPDGEPDGWAAPLLSVMWGALLLLSLRQRRRRRRTDPQQLT